MTGRVFIFNVHVWSLPKHLLKLQSFRLACDFHSKILPNTYAYRIFSYHHVYLYLVDLIEGDIVIDESTAFAVVDFKRPASSRQKRETPRKTVNVWNNAVIPYVISEEMSK